MYDAWTKFNSHYVALLVMYTDPDTKKVRTRLVSCTPLMTGRRVRNRNDAPPGSRVVEMETNTDSGEHTESFVFDGNAYAEHIKYVFNELGVDFHDWCICQVTDNAAVMKKAARILKIYVVGCKSHSLHLAVNASLPVGTQQNGARDASPNRNHVLTIQSCNETMKNAKMQHKAGAVLRSLTKLRPKVMVPNR